MKTRANGEGNIRQRDDGRWEVRVTLGIDYATGQPKRISRYADTQEEAIKILHEMSYLKDTSPKMFNSITLGEWLDLCLDLYMKNTLKQSTYVSYEGYIRIHLKPSLGSIPIKELTSKVLQQFYNYKAETWLSPKTIVNINLFLHRALSYAVNEGYIQSNPAASVNLSRGSKPQIEILTRDEQLSLMRGSCHHRYGVFVRLVLFTGIRMGELLGLRWEDIDFQSSTMHIRRTLNRLSKIQRPVNPDEPTTEIVIQTPKSQNSIRSIPLLPAVICDLQSYKALQQQEKTMAGNLYNDTGFVVTNEFGGYVEPKTFKKYYNQILEICGLRHFTFHALRHTFASRAMEQGMDAKTLSSILGHYSVAFTLDTYAHVLDDHKREGMALMDELYNSAQIQPQEFSYPVIITTNDDGSLNFSLPDFPEFFFDDFNMQTGLQYIKERLQEELLTVINPPIPTPSNQIILQSNQMLIQLPI